MQRCRCSFRGAKVQIWQCRDGGTLALCELVLILAEVIVQVQMRRCKGAEVPGAGAGCWVLR